MLITEIQIKTEEAFTFLYGEEPCAYSEVASKGQATMDGLQDFVQQTFIEITGDAVWAYTPAGEQRLILRAGFPVKPGTKAVKPFAVEDVAKWKCLSAMYRGSMEQITDAWGELWAQVSERGLEGTHESREIYRTWIDYNSTDNVTELQVRLK